MKLIKDFEKFVNINELVITNQEQEYTYKKQPSFYMYGDDYIIEFKHKGVDYVIIMQYNYIGGEENYHIVFCTKRQYWIFKSYFYTHGLRAKKKKKYTKINLELINSLISKETGLNETIPLLRKISNIIIDFYYKEIPNKKLSISDTINPKKIRIYRNLIKNSFKNVEENIIKNGEDNIYIYHII